MIYEEMNSQKKVNNFEIIHSKSNATSLILNIKNETPFKSIEFLFEYSIADIFA